jgi:hypothetical protein
VTFESDRGPTVQPVGRPIEPTSTFAGRAFLLLKVSGTVAQRPPVDLVRALDEYGRQFAPCFTKTPLPMEAVNEDARSFDAFVVDAAVRPLRR